MTGFARKLSALRNMARVSAIVVLGLASAVATPAAAATSQVKRAAMAIPQQPYIVRTDYGGSVQKRLTDIQALRTTQRRVEIRGNVCYSSCTMLLGLSNACVHPNTVFGFHGPSRRGQPLSKPLFDQVSHIIGMHYPPMVRTWYMAVARHSLNDLHTLTGQDLITLGVAKPCDAPIHVARAMPLRAATAR